MRNPKLESRIKVINSIDDKSIKLPDLIYKIAFADPSDKYGFLATEDDRLEFVNMVLDIYRLDNTRNINDIISDVRYGSGVIVEYDDRQQMRNLKDISIINSPKEKSNIDELYSLARDAVENGESYESQLDIFQENISRIIDSNADFLSSKTRSNPPKNDLTATVKTKDNKSQQKEVYVCDKLIFKTFDSSLHALVKGAINEYLKDLNVSGISLEGMSGAETTKTIYKDKASITGSFVGGKFQHKIMAEALSQYLARHELSEPSLDGYIENSRVEYGENQELAGGYNQEDLDRVGIHNKNYEISLILEAKTKVSFKGSQVEVPIRYNTKINVESPSRIQTINEIKDLTTDINKFGDVNMTAPTIQELPMKILSLGSQAVVEDDILAAKEEILSQALLQAYNYNVSDVHWMFVNSESGQSTAVQESPKSAIIENISYEEIDSIFNIQEELHHLYILNIDGAFLRAHNDPDGYEIFAHNQTDLNFLLDMVDFAKIKKHRDNGTLEDVYGTSSCPESLYEKYVGFAKEDPLDRHPGSLERAIMGRDNNQPTPREAIRIECDKIMKNHQYLSDTRSVRMVEYITKVGQAISGQDWMEKLSVLESQSDEDYLPKKVKQMLRMYKTNTQKQNFSAPASGMSH